ncbi:MAG: lipopolysaccharide core heptose(I) kinase RfaP [Methylotenera sp.]|nr:lipopolysaccharide core heptose(I) kinase RfaP [Methylotenera sp.]
MAKKILKETLKETLKEIVTVPNEIKQYLVGHDVFSAMMNLSGKVFRDVRGRKTMQLTLGEKSYFIKQHFGVGWAEIIKNLLSFKKPILGAITEVNAIKKLDEIGIATTPLVAYGVSGCNPAIQQSFILTDDLGDIVSLEDLCLSWQSSPPDVKFKRRLIIAVAKLARKLHESGVNHRDFYLCHLCLDAQLLKRGKIKLYLIDLHRMLIHRSASQQHSMKDIAALYFSSMDVALTPRDYLRFKHYYGQGFSICTTHFWQQVETRALKLYAKFHSDKFQKRLADEKRLVD